MRRKSRYRCFFVGTPPRDVWAYDSIGARKTAEYAQRLLGFPKVQIKPFKVEFVCDHEPAVIGEVTNDRN